MDLTATTELKLAPRKAWAELTDFAAFEKLLRERGAELTRSATPDPPGVGTRWEGAFDYSGKRRDVSAGLVALDPERSMTFELQSAGLAGRAEVTLEQLAAKRCRVDLALHLEARTLRARLFLQPLKLAHATLEQRLSARLDRIARAIESRQQKRVARAGRGGSSL